jgi:hypothetical protein
VRFTSLKRKLIPENMSILIAMGPAPAGVACRRVDQQTLQHVDVVFPSLVDA